MSFFGKVKEAFASSKSVSNSPYVIEQAKARAEFDKTKSVVSRNEKLWPQDLGEEHPRNFKKLQQWYSDDPFCNALVEKHIDFVMGGGISVESKDGNAEEVIRMFMEDNSFETLIRDWLRDGFITGNGYLEIGGKRDESPQGLKVVNPNTVFIKRSKKGKVELYNQWLGNSDVRDFYDFNNVLSFETFQIAHVKFGQVGDCPYGSGLIAPIEYSLSKKTKMLNDMSFLMTRKANSPYVIYLGDKALGEGLPMEDDAATLGKKFEWLNNSHEWVFSDLVRVEKLDFGDIGGKFTAPLELLNQELIFGGQIPAVLMGVAKIPEGLASEQMKAWLFRVKSLQEDIEKVIEEQIFKRVLNDNGFGENVKVEIVWGVPTSDEKRKDVTMLTGVLNSYSSFAISETMREEIEKLIAGKLDIPDFDVKLKKAEKEREEEAKRAQPVIPPESPVRQQDKKPGSQGPPSEPANKPAKTPKGKKPVEFEYYSIEEEGGCTCCEGLGDNDNMPLKEWVGFNYDDFKEDISAWIDSDEFVKREFQGFKFLAGSNFQKWEDVMVSYNLRDTLSRNQVSKLRTVLKDAFSNGDGLNVISRRILNEVKPIDLPVEFKTSKGDKRMRVISSRQRSIHLARTETVRATTNGSLNNYLKFGYENVRWISSAGERTCSYCDSQNGLVLSIAEARERIPAHNCCNCAFAPVVE